MSNNRDPLSPHSHTASVSEGTTVTSVGGGYEIASHKSRIEVTHRYNRQRRSGSPEDAR